MSAEYKLRGGIPIDIHMIFSGGAGSRIERSHLGGLAKLVMLV